MLQRPAFKPHYHVEPVEGYGIVLLSEKDHAIVPGPLYALLTPYLDGSRSAHDIADQLQGHVALDEVHEALAQLTQKGYLAEGMDMMPASEAALWSIQQIDPQVAARRLMETTVSVHAIGSVTCDPFVATLHSLDVRTDDTGSLGVVLTDDYLHPDLQAFNEACLQKERPWMLVKPIGCEIWVGPVFQPWQSGCWECLAQRLRANRRVETLLHRGDGAAQPFALARGHTPATLQVAWNLAASKIAEWVARGELPDLDNRLLTFNVQTLETQFHRLVWRPQCPACGCPIDGLNQPARPIVIESGKKAFTQDGGHRVVPPEITLKRYEHHISPITGAVSQMKRLGASSKDVIHTYRADQNAAIHPHSLDALRKGLRSHSGGKGASDLQARTSALSEALERYSAVFQGYEPHRFARLKDLGDAAIHPNLCMLFSDRQYRERDTWNARGSRFNAVPVPFDEDEEIAWSPVWSLTQKEHRFLPTAYCYFNYPTSKKWATCKACSNGNAAGNTLEEAILQGFLELVERDSVALWWYNRLRRPAIDLDSFHEPYLDNVRAFLQDRHRNLWVLDLTADLGIPVFAALSGRTHRQPERILLGFGAHLDPRIALLRAVSELGQMLAFYLDSDDLLSNDHHDDDVSGNMDLALWLRTATLDNQPYLLPDAKPPYRVASDYRKHWSDDLKEDVLACQTLVEQKGLEMLVLDQTRPDIGMPVVKVFVPGLRHFWARFAAGRLYDVPVKLGWLTEPRTEEQLNPIPFFF